MIRVLGVPHTIGALLGVATRVSTAAPRATASLAEEVAEHARALVPVLTGETQASIEATSEGVSAEGAAVYLEFGTSRMPAQPFMRPAADEAKGDEARAVLRAAVGGV